MMEKNYLTNPPKIWMVMAWVIFCLLVGLCVIAVPSEFSVRYDLIYFVSIGLFGALWINTYWNYPLVKKDCIEIRNLLFPSRKYRYCDIVQAEIVNTGRGPCLFIKLRERRFKKRVCIDCVDNKALDELLIDLRQRNVNVVRKSNPFE